MSNDSMSTLENGSGAHLQDLNRQNKLTKVSNQDGLSISHAYHVTGGTLNNPKNGIISQTNISNANNSNQNNSKNNQNDELRFNEIQHTPEPALLKKSSSINQIDNFANAHGLHHSEEDEQYDSDTLTGGNADFFDNEGDKLSRISSTLDICSQQSKGNRERSNPNLIGSPTRRKKTSEASPLILADDLNSQLRIGNNEGDLGRLQAENKALKGIIKQLEDEKKKIVDINHSWDEQYQKLSIQMKEILSAKEKELSIKQEEISRLQKKIETLISEYTEGSNFSNMTLSNKSDSNDDYSNKGIPHDSDVPNNDYIASMKQLIVDLKEENKALKRVEQMHQQQIKETHIRYQWYEQRIQQDGSTKTFLEQEVHKLSKEVHRLSTWIGRKYEVDPMNIIDGRMTGSKPIPATNVDNQECELLKQQLQVYKEDFGQEKQEKEKLKLENNQLLTEIQDWKEKCAHFLHQLKNYEDDFRRERDKRIELMKKQLPSRSGTPPSRIVDDGLLKWKEYCRLVVEKDNLDDRIKDLEDEGVTAYQGRQTPVYSQTSVGAMNSPYLPRGLPTMASESQQQPDIHLNLDSFYGGDVVRDSGKIMDWSKPYSRDSSIIQETPISTFRPIAGLMADSGPRSGIHKSSIERNLTENKHRSDFR